MNVIVVFLIYLYSRIIYYSLYKLIIYFLLFIVIPYIPHLLCDRHQACVQNINV